VAFLALVAGRARADENADAARADFLQGVELVRSTNWAGALEAFERSSAKKTHPVTTYNIGLCRRALGQYVLAKRAFDDALAKNALGGGALLPTANAEDARAIAAEIDKSLVHVDVDLAPGAATVTVDSRPLEREGDHYVGGTLAPGPGEPVAFSAVSEGHARFTVTLDPGAHVLTFAAPGHTESVYRESFAAASHKRLAIVLLELAGTLRVSASPVALVYVDGASMGMAPISVDRPKGSYRVSVRKDGFAPFETTAILRPGERTELTAALRVAPTPITKKWWFYAIIAGVAAAGVVTTYAVVRANETPAPNGGTIGWVVSPP
jgi:hypothetical protein